MILLKLALLVVPLYAQPLQLFLETGSLPTGVTAGSACGNALQSSINCSDALLQATPGSFDGNITDSICQSSCISSLLSYRNTVASSCANVQLQSDDVTYPATFHADLLIYSFNSTCLRDQTTGDPCNPFFQSVANGTIETDSSISAVSPDTMCSSCMIQLAELSQQSPFGYSPDLAGDWPIVQQTCGINLNLTVPIPVYLNVSIPPPPATTCLSGQTYLVKPGDTCTLISQSQSVGTGNLISVNGLSVACTEIQAGQTLCLPQPCSLYQIQSGDTCNSILNSNNIDLVPFFAWNPTINPLCTNLIAGSYVCVSPPGGSYTFVPPATSVAPTGTFITTPTPAPAPTSVGTITNCGKWYVVQPGDTCNRVILNQTITLDNFLLLNPEINEDCTNLILGFAYCVFAVPLPPFPSTFAPVPTNVASGSTTNCYTWYTVQSGDTCGTITQSHNVALSDFLTWNPELNAQCSNLLLGESYCIFAQPGPTQNSTGSSTPVSTSPPSTSSTTSPTSTSQSSSTTSSSDPPVPTNAAPGSISPCHEWYTAVSGDFCFQIAQNEGCTVQDLMTWNPSLGTNCLVLVGVAYCVSG